METDDIEFGDWNSLLKRIDNAVMEGMNKMNEPKYIDFSDDLIAAMKNIDAINEVVCT